MERDAEIVIVGAGVAGLAAARALAGDGRDVLLLEQFELGHARGSSHGATRIFRLSYSEPHWVRLAQASLPLWRELEREAGETLLSTEGSLASALAAGARVVERTRVVALKEEGAGVRIDTAAGALRARAVVVTAGAWAAALLAGAGIELPVVATRETVCHFRLPGAPPRPSLIDWLTPSTPAYGTARAGQLSYALPDPGFGLKAGLHHAGPPADADRDGEPDAATVRWLADWVASRFPDADPEPAEAVTCLYTNTADESFVLERRGRIVVGSACSGHGFKFAPAIGRTLAAHAREAAR